VNVLSILINWMKSQVTRSIEGPHRQAHFFNFFFRIFDLLGQISCILISQIMFLLPVDRRVCFFFSIVSGHTFLSLLFFVVGCTIYLLRIPFFCVYMMFFFLTGLIYSSLSFFFWTLDVHYSFAYIVSGLLLSAC